MFALVGPTGAGKSTLVNLLPAFYETVSGKILIDDQDINSISLESLRENISVVSQEAFLFNGTYSATVAVGGSATTALGKLAEIAPYLPGRVAATTLVLTPDRHRGGVAANLLVRVSEPVEGKRDNLGSRLRKVLGDAGLTVQRLDGEQGELLRATTPLGLSDGSV